MDTLRLARGDVSLAAVNFGGRGPRVIFLHGLAGYGGEWAETASWLRERLRVVAPDLRGHGASTRVPASMSPEAFVGDVVGWLRAFAPEGASLVGQSFGGLIAFLTAARHPELVARLVVAEASPAPDPDAEIETRGWLESWPVPFPDEESAVRFFGGESLRARAWAHGLEVRNGGLWPRFDIETLVRALHEAARGWWKEWGDVRCPTLVVRGERGLAADVAEEMAARVEGAVLATVPDAGHDVHLDAPAGWRSTLEPFLAPQPR